MLCDRDQCLGCAACADACPVGAIDFAPDYLLMKRPRVDSSRCVGCGRCNAACPVLNPPARHRAPFAYAAYSTDLAELRGSSSGGIASLLARDFIEHGGVVFGATVFHGYPKTVAIERAEEVDRLRGSKYVWSDPAGSYRDVQKRLNDGCRCLYIGTPCQVAALLSFLGGAHERLLTVDLVCHGTPPFGYLQQHVSAQLGSYDDVDNVTFREESAFSLKAYGKNGVCLYQCDRYEDDYYAAFTKDVTFREPCYSCPFANADRVSDITLGDYWGLGSDALGGYAGRVSLVLPNTDRGRGVLERCNDVAVFERRSLDEAVAGNDQLRAPSERSELRSRFVEALAGGCDVSQALRMCGVHRETRKRVARRILLAPLKSVRDFLRRFRG